MRSGLIILCACTAITQLSLSPVHAGDEEFLRGDANTDGVVNVVDVLALLDFAFNSYGELTCEHVYPIGLPKD